MSIKYSIIIPHFNSENSLNRLLNSIPSDDCIEVLVIDDQSSTNYFEQVIKQSQLANVFGFKNDGAKGAGAARNIGLQKARGKFIIFADADDFFTENAFVYIDTAIKAIKEEGVGIIFFNVISENINTGEPGSRHLKSSTLVKNYINQSGKYYEDKIRLTHNVPWGKVFCSDFVKTNELKFEEVLVSNDVMFSVKAGKLADKIACFNDEIYCVTESENTLTTKKSLKNFWIRVAVYARYYNFLTVEERKRVSASPLPFLFQNLSYGPKQILKAIFFLKQEKVFIIKDFRISKYKLRQFFRRLF